MKKLFPFFLSLLALTACTSEYDRILNDASRTGNPGDGVAFYATIEETGAADLQTKVYADEQMRVLWNAGDTISLFKKTILNRPYRFTGQEGSNAGGFKALPIDDEFLIEPPLSYNYAIYPYREETLMSYEGELAVDMPAVQFYKEKSFGIGANTMVSVTEGNVLQFKNVGGYLSFKFYGDGVSIKSITLKGNNHEKLAGAATVTMSLGSTPVVTMLSTAKEEITLICSESVSLGVDSEYCTEFWFVIPPTEFTKGFTVTVTDKRGGAFTTATSSAVSVTRNSLSRMAPIEVVPEYQYVPFDDANFKAYCVSNFDRNSDGEISMSEASNIRNINVSTADIESLQGIEYMPNLRFLYCQGQSNNNRGKLTNLDVRKNTALTTLYCQYNQLTNLIVSNNTKLTSLYCQYNQLTSLDVRKNTALTTLYCQYNQLTNLIVSNNTKLTRLYCQYNQLASLDVNHNTSLTTLFCNNNQLTSLDLSQNSALTNLQCYTNQLTRLDVSHNKSLQSLSCYNNQLTGLDVSTNTALTSLNCGQNQLKNLDVSQNASLQSLTCSNNQLTSISVSNNAALKHLNCGGNQLTSLEVSQNSELTDLYCYSNQLSGLDVSHNTALTNLQCFNNQLTSIDISNNTEITYLECGENQLTSLDVSQNTALTNLLCDQNQLTNLDVSKNSALSVLYCSNNASNLMISIRSGQIIKIFRHDNTASIIETGDPIRQGNISFTDPNVKAYCVNQFDVNKDGEISYAEALLITGIYFSKQNITSLAGIEFFENLRYLSCDQTQLKELDVSKNTKLSELGCSYNQLTSLDVNNNLALRFLSCEQNQLTSLDVSQNTALTELNCGENKLTTLDVSNNAALTGLNCSYNQLTGLDVSHNTVLAHLYCDNNQLTSLDVSNNAALTDLHCSGNPNLAEIWLNTNQTIPNFSYDSNITTIKYKE